jgi:hypothetical protein
MKFIYKDKYVPNLNISVILADNNFGVYVDDYPYNFDNDMVFEGTLKNVVEWHYAFVEYNIDAHALKRFCRCLIKNKAFI